MKIKIIDNTMLHWYMFNSEDILLEEEYKSSSKKTIISIDFFNYSNKFYNFINDIIAHHISFYLNDKIYMGQLIHLTKKCTKNENKEISKWTFTFTLEDDLYERTNSRIC